MSTPTNAPSSVTLHVPNFPPSSTDQAVPLLPSDAFASRNNLVPCPCNYTNLFSSMKVVNALVDCCNCGVSLSPAASAEQQRQQYQASLTCMYHCSRRSHA